MLCLCIKNKDTNNKQLIKDLVTIAMNLGKLGYPYKKYHSNQNAIEWYLNGPRGYYGQGYLNGIWMFF